MWHLCLSTRTGGFCHLPGGVLAFILAEGQRSWLAGSLVSLGVEWHCWSALVAWVVLGSTCALGTEGIWALAPWRASWACGFTCHAGPVNPPPCALPGHGPPAEGPSGRRPAPWQVVLLQVGATAGGTFLLRPGVALDCRGIAFLSELAWEWSDGNARQALQGVAVDLGGKGLRGEGRTGLTQKHLMRRLALNDFLRNVCKTRILVRGCFCRSTGPWAVGDAWPVSLPSLRTRPPPQHPVSWVNCLARLSCCPWLFLNVLGCRHGLGTLCPHGPQWLPLGLAEPP